MRKTVTKKLIEKIIINKNKNLIKSKLSVSVFDDVSDESCNQFHQRSTSSFSRRADIPKAQRRHSGCPSFLRSPNLHAKKAARRSLMKLTPASANDVEP